MIYKNVANQKLPLYLVNSSGQPVTGEAANITAYISVDGGTPQQVSPVTEVGGGYYVIAPSQAQTNGDLLLWWGTHATYICRGGEAFTSRDYTAARAQALDNLDASITSRLAASDYTPPDNTSIAAIKAQTDKLTFSGDDVKATLDGETVTVATNQDKTGYTLATNSVNAIADAVWDETRADHTTAGTYGKTSEWATTAAGVWNADTRTLTAFTFGVTVSGYDTGLSPSEQITSLGYTASRAAKLDNLDASVSTRLAAASYVAPDNASIAAIKSQTDKLTFDSSNNVYATVDVDEQAIADAIVSAIGDEQLVQVIVTPIAANLIQQATHGGHIDSWTHARITASWTIPGNDLSGHDLRMIIYKPSDPTTRVAEFKSDTGLTVSYNSGTGQSTISLNADPISAGSYAWIIRDQTTDTVILKGTMVVYAAPDAS